MTAPGSSVTRKTSAVGLSTRSGRSPLDVMTDQDAVGLSALQLDRRGQIDCRGV
jgi:hypothetical protein